jgi:hypothetical protein
MYYADAVTVPAALVAAKQRGVDVQVIMDDAIKQHTTADNLLRTGLGTDTGQGSFFMTCPADRGCIANQGTWSIMHAKFFLFTSTLGVSNVVVQTSTHGYRCRPVTPRCSTIRAPAAASAVTRARTP